MHGLRGYLMKHVPWFRSIRYLIPILLIALVTIPLFVLMQFNSSAMSRITLENAQASALSELSNKALSIDNSLNAVSQFATSQVGNSEIQALTEQYIQASPEDRSAVRARITLKLRQAANTIPQIDDVFIVVEGADTIISTTSSQRDIPITSEKGSLLYQDYIEGFPGLIGWSSIAVDRDAGISQLIYHRPFQEHDGLPRYSLLCSVDPAYMHALIESSAFDQNIVMACDYAGNVLLNSGGGSDANIRETLPYNQAFLSRSKDGSYLDTDMNGVNCSVSYYTSMTSGWKYIYSVPSQTIYGSIQNQTPRTIIVLILSVISIFAGTLLISRTVVSPLNRTIRAMKSTENGEFTSLSEPISQNELGIIMLQYNNMVARLKDLIDRIYRQELLRKEAQLRTLHSQVNSHFLYNSLNSIYSVTEQGDTQHAGKMLVMLSKYFRLNLSEGHEFIRISEVIQLLQSYLYIQKARYSDRMKVHLHADSSLSDYYVLKYLFQPIVENAIVYGIENKIGECIIDITFRKDGDCLFFSTADNGIGIPPQDLQDLRDSIADGENTIGPSFALKNISAQIKLAYGKEYGLTIDSTYGKGTTVSFRIPLRKEA